MMNILELIKIEFAKYESNQAFQCSNCKFKNYFINRMILQRKDELIFISNLLK